MTQLSDDARRHLLRTFALDQGWSTLVDIYRGKTLDQQEALAQAMMALANHPMRTGLTLGPELIDWVKGCAINAFVEVQQRAAQLDQQEAQG